MHVAVIGHGEAVHAQLPDVADQLADAVGAVQEGVFAVGMEMYEGHGVQRDTAGLGSTRR